MKVEDFEAAVAKCILFPKRGRYLVMEDGFAYTGKLVIPDNAKRRPTSGVIIKTGGDCDESWLGQRVVYGAFSGTLVQIKNHPPYRLLSEDEILASVVVEDFELENVSS